MSNFGLIHVNFPDHPKVELAGNAAVGLWARCNGWCRRNRKRGYVPRRIALRYGTPEEIASLVKNGLWDDAEDGYQFHDYGDWNPDERDNSDAAVLVRRSLTTSHPERVRKKLQLEVQLLLKEGFDTNVVGRALRKWDAKGDAGPALLPLLVSDVVKEQRDDDVLEVIRQAWRTYDIQPLKQYGYWFPAPQVWPREWTIEQTREFHRQKKREWLEGLEERIINERKTEGQRAFEDREADR